MVKQNNTTKAKTRFSKIISSLEGELSLEPSFDVPSGKIIIADPKSFNNDILDNVKHRKAIFEDLEKKLFDPATGNFNYDCSDYYVELYRLMIENIKEFKPPYFLSKGKIIGFYYDTKIRKLYFPIGKTPLDIQIPNCFSRDYVKTIGNCLISEGIVTISDFNNIQLKENVDKESYCVLTVPIGTYSCKFIKDNRTVSIQRKD